jgi:hypothetical protein
VLHQHPGPLRARFRPHDYLMSIYLSRANHSNRPHMDHGAAGLSRGEIDGYQRSGRNLPLSQASHSVGLRLAKRSHSKP